MVIKTNKQKEKLMNKIDIYMRRSILFEPDGFDDVCKLKWRLQDTDIYPIEASDYVISLIK